MTGMFEGLSPVEGPPVGGDGFFLHGHFDGSGIKKEGGLLTGIGCWNGVPVALQGDEPRGGNGGRFGHTGFLGDGRQGVEGFLFQGLAGLFPRGPVDPVVSFPPPAGEFFIQIFQIVKDVNHDEVFPDIPDHSFDTPFFIGPAWVASIEGKPVVGGKVGEPGIVDDAPGCSFQDDAFEIVIADLPGLPPDLAEGLEMTVEEELHGEPGIEPGKKIAAPGEKEDEAVDHAEGQFDHHPVHLGLLPGKEGELMEGPGFSFRPEGFGKHLDGGVPAFEPIGPKAVEDLDGLEGGVGSVPGVDEAGKGGDDAGTFSHLRCSSERPGHLVPGQARFPGDLAGGKVFHLEEVPDVPHHGLVDFFHDCRLLFKDGRIMRKPPRPWRPFLQSGVRLGKTVQIDFERVHFCNHGDHPERPAGQAGPGSERVHFCNHRPGASSLPVPEALEKPVSPGLVGMAGPVALPVAGMVRRPHLVSLFLVCPVGGIGFHPAPLPGRLAGPLADLRPAEPLPFVSFPRCEQDAAMTAGNLPDRLHRHAPPFMERRSRSRGKTPKEASPRCSTTEKRIPDIPSETMKKCFRNFSEEMIKKG